MNLMINYLLSIWKKMSCLSCVKLTCFWSHLIFLKVVCFAALAWAQLPYLLFCDASFLINQGKLYLIYIYSFKWSFFFRFLFYHLNLLFCSKSFLFYNAILSHFNLSYVFKKSYSLSFWLILNVSVNWNFSSWRYLFFFMQIIDF